MKRSADKSNDEPVAKQKHNSQNPDRNLELISDKTQKSCKEGTLYQIICNMQVN